MIVEHLLTPSSPEEFHYTTCDEVEHLGLLQTGPDKARLITLQTETGTQGTVRYRFTRGKGADIPDRAWYIGSASFPDGIRHLFELPEDEG